MFYSGMDKADYEKEVEKYMEEHAEELEEFKRNVIGKSLQEETQELGASLKKIFFNIFEKPISELIKVISKIINKK